MHVWKYKPDILDPPDIEEEDRAILQYLRHGGTLFGDRIGAIEGFVPATKPYRYIPEPEPEPKPKIVHPWEPEFIGPPRPPEYRVRCIQCDRSMPFNPSRESICSKKCQKAIDRYREEVLTWMGMK
jgi:hypothetical protein